MLVTLAIEGISTMAALADDVAASEFHLSLRPTEGALLAIHGRGGRKADMGWLLDGSASEALEHVDLVDIGQQPGSAQPTRDDAAAGHAIRSLFSAPKVWGWGVRAISFGEARATLAAKAAEARSEARIVLHVRVEETDTASLRLPLVVGERVTLELWSNPSTGAQWQINAAQSDNLDGVQVTAGRSFDPDDPLDWRRRGLVGKPVLQEWRIAAAAAGRTRLTLDYGQPWETGTPPWRRLVIDIGSAAE
ncbi:MAG: protease inhibitor I42 family protein [Rhodobiaceae bacterium]|nr:protease inhibitor I42 family protein [Rhodobiaceae bacterium]